jgi:lipooligosaccharide transport system ATP-binding protein
MRMIGCVSPVSDGVLRVLGMDPAIDGARIRARLGVVPQADTLDTELTVRENLLIYARYFDISRREARRRLDELLDFVQLRERADEPVDSLSGGMKRRLTIARALVNDPAILILDEPTTALDPQARLMVWQKLGELKARGVTLIVTTHYMEEAARLCDRLVIMHEGRILTEGSPQRLIADHAAEYVLELPRHGPYNDVVLSRLGDRIRFHETVGDTLFVYSRDGMGVRHSLVELGVPSQSATAREATLEDVFLRLTGRDLDE